MNTFILDPDARLDYVFDWSAWLTDGETIDTAEIIVTPDTLTVAPSGSPTVVTDTTVTVWLADAVLDTKYDVTCRIRTTAGREDDRSMKIRSLSR